MIIQIKEIAKTAVQVMENTIEEASHNKLLQNIKDFYKNNNASDNNSDQYNQPYQPQ